MSCRRVCAVPLQRPRACDSAPGSQPSREASQPQNSSPEASESSRWRTVTPRDLRQVRPPARRVERRRDPLAPRRRAQPGEVDDVGVAGQVVGARQRGLDVRFVLGVDQDDLRQPAQRVDASAWPCGDHTIVARSETTSGSTIVSSLGRWRSPISSSMRSRPTEIAPDARGVVGADPRDRRQPPAPRLDRDHDQPRRVVAADALRAGSRSRRGSPCRRSRPCSSRAPARTRAPPCGAAANILRSAASIAPGVVSSSRQTSSMAYSPRQRCGAISSSAAAGPPEPDA